MNKVVEMLDRDRIPFFIFIGTEMSYIDGIAPRLGTKLAKEYRVLGTVGNNLDNLSIPKKRKDISKINKKIYQTIGVDCAFHHDYKGIERVILIPEGIMPGSYLKRNHKAIGEFGIGINVSPAVTSIEEFITPEKRRDIYEIENYFYDFFLNIKDKYSNPMQIAILRDLKYTKEEIMVKLQLTEEEYILYKESLQNVNKLIYERV